VGVIGEKIAFVGDLSAASAAVRFDATGLAVTPGFIDIHSHATSDTVRGSDVVQRPLAESYIRQGVTTAMGGQDGSSPEDVGAFLAYLDAYPAAMNIGLFVGHGTLRARVVGQDDRRATPDEIAGMTALVERALNAGAFGLSSGLEYTPGAFADTEELVALSRPVGRAGGLYISHIRDEGARVLDSISEVIRVGEEAGVAAQVTHHKVIGKGRWGRSRETLRLIDEARARGVDVMSDQYPYTASATGLTILLPDWAKAGGTDALLERLADPEIRARIRSDVIDHINEERGGDPATIVASRCPNAPENDGLSLADMLVRDGRPVTVENAADTALRLVEGGSCSGVFHSMSEEDVVRIMQHPMTMIASDGGIPEPGEGVPHPRNYGTFARVLGHYVRDEGNLTLEAAVRKMTRLPADRLDLTNRGRLEAGAIADISVFDPERIQDRATFADPHHYATGVRYVIVSGEPVLVDGEPTGLRPGEALRHGR
jgi:dihydroorotase/N-acyl-D-amino-acid deacylase